MSQYPPQPSSFGDVSFAGAQAMSAAPVKTSVLAILSLVLGFFGCTVIAAPISIVLGIIGLTQISKSGGRLKGRGLAIAGICVASATMLMSCGLLGLFLPALGKAREQARVLKTEHSLSRLHAHCITYAAENGDQFPPADNWEMVLASDLGDITAMTASPFDEVASRAYAMNSNLRGKRFKDVARPGATVLMFEVRPGSPQAGLEELLPARPRTRRGYAVLFVDGHTEWVKPERASALIWEP